MSSSSRVAVVTGSNRGIGFSIVRGLCQRYDGVVYLTSRDPEKGKRAVALLNEDRLFPQYHQLDIEDRQSILQFKKHVEDNYGGIDILINNAAVFCKMDFTYDYEESKKVIDVNFRSILTIQELLFPLVREHGRILNISSVLGHLANIRNRYWVERLSSQDLAMKDVEDFVDWFLAGCENKTFKKEDIADNATFAAARVAKVALSGATFVQQKELEGRCISVNCMHPGVVRTDMTQGVGFYSADEAAATPLYLVLDAPASLRGSYVWHDGTVMDWHDYTSDCYFRASSFLQLSGNK